MLLEETHGDNESKRCANRLSFESAACTSLPGPHYFLHYSLHLVYRPRPLGSLHSLACAFSSRTLKSWRSLPVSDHPDGSGRHSSRAGASETWTRTQALITSDYCSKITPVSRCCLHTLHPTCLFTPNPSFCIPSPARSALKRHGLALHIVRYLHHGCCRAFASTTRSVRHTQTTQSCQKVGGHTADDHSLGWSETGKLRRKFDNQVAADRCFNDRIPISGSQTVTAWSICIARARRSVAHPSESLIARSRPHDVLHGFWMERKHLLQGVGHRLAPVAQTIPKEARQYRRPGRKNSISVLVESQDRRFLTGISQQEISSPGCLENHS